MNAIFIKKLCEFFLLSVSLGVGLFSPLASTRLTGHGFIKLLSSVCAVALLLALFFNFNFLYLAAIFFYVLVYFNHQDQKSPFMWFCYFAQNLLLTMALYHFSAASLATFFYLYSSLLLLGVITYCMILGHWYLVVPKLSERPLILGSYWIAFFLLIKIAISFFNVIQLPTFEEEYSFKWMMLLMRIGWGEIIIAILSYFSWRLIKMRSIQSATGVLYVMTFFIFIGELISIYLFYTYGFLV